MLIDEMGDLSKDLSDIKLPPQVKDKLEYHSSPPDTDDLRGRIETVLWKHYPTKHYPAHIDGLLDDLLALCSEEADKAVKKEKLLRLAAQIREGELKAKLEPLERFAALIAQLTKPKEEL